MKQLQTEKVELKKKNALLTKQTKDVKREIEELERRKKTVEKFSAGNRQFAAVRNSTLKSHAMASSQSSTTKRTENQPTKQPAEKRLKIDNNAKASNRILTPPPKPKPTPRKNLKPRPNQRPQFDASALFEENERSKKFEIPTKIDVTVDGSKVSTQTSQTQNTQQLDSSGSSSDSSRDSYGMLSIQGLAEFTAWHGAVRKDEDLKYESLNCTLACYPDSKEFAISQAQKIPSQIEDKNQSPSKKHKKKHHEVIAEFEKRSDPKRTTRNTIKGYRFGKLRSQTIEKTGDLIKIAKTVPRRVQPIELPEFRPVKEKISYDYHDTVLVRKPSWLQTTKCIAPKQFGRKNNVTKVNFMKSEITPLAKSLKQNDNCLVTKIDRMVISPESIKHTEFVTYLFGRIEEFAQLISEDNHKCYVYYFQEFYKLLGSARKAMHSDPIKDWL